MSICEMEPETEEREYRYSELSEEAKAEARKWWFEQAALEETPGLLDLLSRDLADHHGLTDCKLYYSLNYCQGDGVAFEGHPDLDEWARHDERVCVLLAQIQLAVTALGFEIDNLSVSITHSGNYYHDNSMSVLAEVSWWNPERGMFMELAENAPAVALLTALEEYLDEAVREISRELERLGYDAIEYHRSDEVAGEALESMDGVYLFDKDGEFIG